METDSIASDALKRQTMAVEYVCDHCGNREDGYYVLDDGRVWKHSVPPNQWLLIQDEPGLEAWILVCCPEQECYNALTLPGHIIAPMPNKEN